MKRCLFICSLDIDSPNISEDAGNFNFSNIIRTASKILQAPKPLISEVNSGFSNEVATELW